MAITFDVTDDEILDIGYQGETGYQTVTFTGFELTSEDNNVYLVLDSGKYALTNKGISVTNVLTTSYGIFNAQLSEEQSDGTLIHKSQVFKMRVKSSVQGSGDAGIKVIIQYLNTLPEATTLSDSDLFLIENSTSGAMKISAETLNDFFGGSGPSSGGSSSGGLTKAQVKSLIESYNYVTESDLSDFVIYTESEGEDANGVLTIKKSDGTVLGVYDGGNDVTIEIEDDESSSGSSSETSSSWSKVSSVSPSETGEIDLGGSYKEVHVCAYTTDGTALVSASSNFKFSAFNGISKSMWLVNIGTNARSFVMDFEIVSDNLIECLARVGDTSSGISVNSTPGSNCLYISGLGSYITSFKIGTMPTWNDATKVNIDVYAR